MRLLILDSKSGEYYSSPLSNEEFPGHDLGIEPEWPVLVHDKWRKFENELEQSAKDFGALIIHTGDVAGVFPPNTVYADVANALKKLVDKIPICFFSGGGVTEALFFKDAMQGYSGATRATRVGELRRLIRAFGETGDFSVFEISPEETSLRIMGALWPIGLFWELTNDKTKGVDVWRNSNPGSVGEFERQFQSYILQVLSQEEKASEFLPKSASNYSVLQQWLHKIQNTNPDQILSDINCLLSCNSLNDWNHQLEILRNRWIGQ